MRVAPDVIITAEHCTPNVYLVPGSLPSATVGVGDELRILAAIGCEDNTERTGRVLVLYDDRSAELSVGACFGNSGGRVVNTSGALVGAVVRQRTDNGHAIVQLF